jgi:hypothetical protein
MQNCPNCNTMMEEVHKPAFDAQDRLQQPGDEPLITSVSRVRSQCPKCQHVEEGFPLPTL